MLTKTRDGDGDLWASRDSAAAAAAHWQILWRRNNPTGETYSPLKEAFLFFSKKAKISTDEETQNPLVNFWQVANDTERPQNCWSFIQFGCCGDGDYFGQGIYVRTTGSSR